jgi:bis(5'-nucleosyl)-tetraphosphatase (symmetrical)
MRRIFVGDIQGCREQLLELLAAVEFVRGVDELYPLGDLVRKGPDSEGVLRVLREFDAKPVLGNHDVRWLQNRRPGDLDPVDADHDAWLRGQPYVRVMHDIIMVHAGLHPKWSEADLEDLSPEDAQFAITARYCDADGSQPPTDWPPPDDPFRPWHAFYRGDKRVVFGHWARQGLYQTKRVLGLDTGCCYGHHLTAWIAEEDRIVQVPGWTP